MTSLRGGAAPEAKSAVAGSGGMAVRRVSRARWSRASAAAWTSAASASGEPSTATRILRYTLLIVRPGTILGAAQDDSRWKVHAPERRRHADVARRRVPPVHNLLTETERRWSKCPERSI